MILEFQNALFNFRIIHTTLLKSTWLITPCPPYYFFNGLLLVLQCLHIFWSYLILRMAFLMISKGQVRVRIPFLWKHAWVFYEPYFEWSTITKLCYPWVWLVSCMCIRLFNHVCRIHDGVRLQVIRWCMMREQIAQNVIHCNQPSLDNFS